MPRCQRTFRLLSSGTVDATSGIGRWVCPYCPDAEIYETVNAPYLLQYATLAQSTCIEDFGRPGDATFPTVLFWGLAPECVMEPKKREYHLYLQRSSDFYQARLQIGHEMFHRVCSQGKIFHWTHEMLACLFSVRLLRQSGATEYANQMEQEYVQQSASCSFEQMVTADLSRPPYPTGLYGRAFSTGRDWLDDYGWKALCQLPQTLGTKHIPDVPAWMIRIKSKKTSDFWEPGAGFRTQD